MALRRWWGWGLVSVLLWPTWAFAGTRCTQNTVVTSTVNTGGTRSDLSDRPSRVCSVEFIANGANGFAQVFDSPDDTESHGQSENVSEPGAAAAGNYASAWYGEEGKPTTHGLDALVYNGTAIIQWSSGP